MEEPVSLSILPSLLFFALGIIYTTATVMLPDASVGRPFEPKIFPLMLGILLIILSLSLMIKEMAALKNRKETSHKEPFYKEVGFRNILLTCGVSVLYALLFDKLGYFLSTVLFLELELILFNSLKNWKINTIVSVVFSLFIYIVFSKVLGVYLPMTPGIWI